MLRTMNIVLTAQSALAAMRLARTPDARFDSRHRKAPFMLQPVTFPIEVLPLSAADLSSDVTIELREILQTPVLHVRVPDERHRVRTPLVATRMGLSEMPARSVFRLLPADGSALRGDYLAQPVYLDGPGLLCAWMATILRAASREGKLDSLLVVPRVASVAMELCGTYARNAFNPRASQVDFGLLPCSRVEDEMHVLAELKGRHGVKDAMVSLARSTNLSASPMETSLFYGLVAPPREGGMHFAPPSVGVSAVPPGFDLARLEGRDVVPDMWWELANLVVEYEGGDFHSSRQALQRDREKMRDYRVLDMQVIPYTFDDVRTVAGLERVARRIAREMDVRLGGRELKRVQRIIRDEAASEARTTVWHQLLPPLTRTT